MLKKKLIVLMVAIFTCMAVLVSQPQAMKPGQGGVKPPEQPGSQNLQQELKEMRENIAAHGWHYTVGPNPAMYRSLDELCGFKAFMDTPSSKDHWAGGTQAPATPQLASTLPSSYVGYASSIKDQGQCGDCWAFSTIAGLEAAVLKESGAPQISVTSSSVTPSGSSPDLSEQHLCSCNASGWSCNGGFFAYDMLDPSQSGSGHYPGAIPESCFPYTASDSNCSFCSDPTYTPVENWAYVGTSSSVPSIDAIKQAIYTYGSVSAAVYADSNFQAYTGGVFEDNSSDSPDHAIILCGWDDSLGPNGAWLLKNSWGTGWGIDGFMWIAYGDVQVGYAACWVTSNVAPSTTYSISGTVKNDGGSAMQGVTVSTSGVSDTTDSSGNYTLSGLSDGSTYTVTASETGYSFSPSSYSVTINSADVTGKDFTGSVQEAASILFVDDDAGKTWDTYFTQALDSLGKTYDTVTVASGANGPDAAKLNQYQAVIWNTGYDWSSTLTSTDESNLGSYLDQGGNLFLSSQDYLYNRGSSSSFDTNYLHLNSYTSDTKATSLKGVSGDPITNGVSYTASYPSGFTDYSDTLVPGSGATGILYAGSTSNAAAIRYSNATYKVVFFATPFEAIPSGSDPNNRPAIMGRILDWLMSTGGNTYSISGSVLDSSYNAVSGATVTLSGDSSGSTTTDASGNYSFSNLNNGSYTVTPSKTDCSFTPTSKDVSITGADVTGQNFTASCSTPTYSISGTVSGDTASGVTMNLTGDASASTTTDSSGNYTFSGLADGSYTVTPSESGYTFSPSSIDVTISGANQSGKNFTSSAIPAGCNALTASYDSTYGCPAATTAGQSVNTSTLLNCTGASGESNAPNTIDGCADGDSGTCHSDESIESISIATTDGSSCLAPGQEVTVTVGTYCYSTADYVTLFYATNASSVTWTKVGSTQEASGSGNLNFTWTFTLSGTSDTMQAVRAQMVYNADPGTDSCYSGSYTDRDDLAFMTGSGTTPTTYSISGTVSGDTASGVTMNLTGDASASTTTDSSGNYTFSGLADGGSYTVTPSESGYTFSPSSIDVTISGSNQTGENFTATQVVTTHSISGTVSGDTASGVTMNLTGDASASTTTDSSGNYTFSDLADGSYTVTPSESGYTFSPTSLGVSLSGSNQTGKNFTATAASSGLDCSSAVTLTSGTAYSSTTSGSPSNVSTYSCTSWNESGPEKVHKVTTTATGDISATLSGMSADEDVFILSACDPDSCNASGDTSATYSSAPAGTYYIVVDGYNGASGSYTLTATFSSGGGGTPSERLVNGGFESGPGAPWTENSSGSYEIIDNTSGVYHGGSYSAWMGDYDNAHDTLYQDVAIPANATTATLSYWWYMDTSESSHSYDYLHVYIKNTSGTTLATVDTQSDGSTSDTWVNKTYDLSSYKGQTIRIFFDVTNDSSNDTSFLIDDVSVMADGTASATSDGLAPQYGKISSGSN